LPYKKDRAGGEGDASRVGHISEISFGLNKPVAAHPKADRYWHRCMGALFL
jgi:hypothetical protein